MHWKITVESCTPCTLRCSNELYALTEVCNHKTGSQPCTLQDTNEIVDIGFDSFSRQ